MVHAGWAPRVGGAAQRPGRAGTGGGQGGRPRAAATSVARYSVDADRPQGSPMTEPTQPHLEPGMPDAALDAPEAPGTSAPPEAAPRAPLRRRIRGHRARMRCSRPGSVPGASPGSATSARSPSAWSSGPPASPSPRARSAAGSIAVPVPTGRPAPARRSRPGTRSGDPMPVTLEIWADYQCPFCRLEDLLFGGAVDREYVAPGIVRIVYRDFAFLGQESTDAAVAARCAAPRILPPGSATTMPSTPTRRARTRAALPGRTCSSSRRSRASRLRLHSRPALTTRRWRRPSPTRRRPAAPWASRPRRPSCFAGPEGRLMAGFNQTWPNLSDALEAIRVAAPGSPPPAGTAHRPRPPDRRRPRRRPTGPRPQLGAARSRRGKIHSA